MGNLREGWNRSLVSHFSRRFRSIDRLNLCMTSSIFYHTLKLLCNLKSLLVLRPFASCPCGFFHGATKSVNCYVWLRRPYTTVTLPNSTTLNSGSLSNRLGEGSRQAFGTTESPLLTCSLLRRTHRPHLINYPSFAGPRICMYDSNDSNTWLANSTGNWQLSTTKQNMTVNYGGCTTARRSLYRPWFSPPPHELILIHHDHLLRFAGCLIVGIYPSCWSLPVSSYAAPLACRMIANLSFSTEICM